MTAGAGGTNLNTRVMESGQKPVYTRRDSCRACAGSRLRLILSLGPQPLANAFLSDPEAFHDEASYPLDVLICEDCALVQIADVIDPEVLFGHYLYVTGTSDTIAAHNRLYARTVVDLLGLGPRDLVVEVASNDGSLLSCFQATGVRTLGVEPARNIADLARERGVETVNRFFDGRAATELRAEYGPAGAVIANNVLAHVDDPGDFLSGAGALIGDDGLVIVEVPYAADMLTRLEYDTVYHEHLSYFTLAPLSRLAASVGLRIARVDRVPVHGGSIRVYFARGKGDAESVVAMLAEERHSGLTSGETWAEFGKSVRSRREEMRRLLQQLIEGGSTIVGYGAPAKGNTMLNYCGIGPDLLPFTVDRNPLKVGRFTPGMHIPVLPVETLEARPSDYILILPWNFADEIMSQQRAHAARGGRWILPIPTPRVL